jgi:hypothetical protein
MQDRLLQRSLGSVVVEGRPFHPQEQGQFRPAFLHVEDRRAERGVRLDFAFGKLRLHPPFEHRHARLAYVLVQLSVGSRTGAPTLGSGGCSTAFAVALSPAANVSFPAPAASNVACGFPRTTLTCLLHASGYETWPLTLHNAGPYVSGSC